MSKSKKYIALMPTVKKFIEAQLPTRPIEEIMEEMKQGIVVQSGFHKKEQQEYIELEISQETFDFIDRHANIEIDGHREKYYVINNLRFRVYEKEQ